MRLNVRKIFIVLTVIVLIVSAGMFWPNTAEKCRRNVLLAKSFKWYELQIPQYDTLYFYAKWPSSDLQCLSADSVAALREYSANAFFSSFSGQIVTVEDLDSLPPEWSGKQIHDAVLATVKDLDRSLAYYEGLRREMDYYDRTHTIVDDGYHMVMAYNEDIKTKQQETSHLRDCLQRILDGVYVKVVLKQKNLVYYQHASGKMDSLFCENKLRDESGISLWQSEKGTMPYELSRFRMNWWPHFTLFFPTSPVRIWANWGYHHYWLNEDSLATSPAVVKWMDDRFSLPLTNGGDGAPVINSLGQLVGVNVRGQLIPSWKIYGMQNKTFGWWKSSVENVMAWIDWTWGKIKMK